VTASLNVSGTATEVGDVAVRRTYAKTQGLGFPYALELKSGAAILLTHQAFAGLAADVLAEMALDDYESRDANPPPLDAEPRVEDLEGCHE
jgi:hypothetical protein